jgi:nondiscriminating glutamyl-tRNA synthetase
VLFNYLFTKKADGKFMLRIEDTDRTRFVEGSVDNMLEILASIGLIPDEWPNNPWEKWPYYQSERLDLYKEHIDILLEKGHAYYCFCSSERLSELREEQEALKLPTKYDKKCRYLTSEEIAEKLRAWEPYTIRLKVPDNQEIEFHDQVRGKIRINSREVDDQVLMKTDWFPTYHFAVVVDDYHMWVTDIIRWDEWIPSTPKHILLYQAFGWEIPAYSHVPQLLWKDGKKLSKRSWDVAVEKYLEKWYLVESLINYLALLWWNPKTTDEFFSMSELIEKFELWQVQRAGAKFDVERLDFFNTHYLKTSDEQQLFNKMLIYLKRYNIDYYEVLMGFEENYNKKIFSELKTRIKHFSQYESYSSLFYNDHKIADTWLFLNEKMKITSENIVKNALEIALEVLWEVDENCEIEDLKDRFIPKIKEKEMKNGQVLWPVRVALSGEEFSPWAFEMIYIYGKEKSRWILEKVLKNFS